MLLDAFAPVFRPDRPLSPPSPPNPVMPPSRVEEIPVNPVPADRVDVEVALVLEGVKTPNLPTGLRKPGREITVFRPPVVVVPDVPEVVDPIEDIFDVEPPKVELAPPVVGTPELPPPLPPVPPCCAFAELHKPTANNKHLEQVKRTFIN